MDERQKRIFNALVNAWPAPLVSRSQVEKFSGGSIRARTLNNLDCRGLGPDGKILVGGRVAYERDNLAEWIAKRVRPL
ncbi:MAG: hypothetical protein EOM25_14930 [Deltaproteobacteria bacterium]|nr:hypothetical protein [Deltaproteobacteria bacterium]